MQHNELNDLWWVDYIENELSAPKRELAKTLLQRSPVDRQIIANLRRLRRLLKQYGAAPLPTNPRYYDDLHDKIMNQLTKQSKQETVAQPAK